MSESLLSTRLTTDPSILHQDDVLNQRRGSLPPSSSVSPPLLPFSTPATNILSQRRPLRTYLYPPALHFLPPHPLPLLRLLDPLARTNLCKARARILLILPSRGSRRPDRVSKSSTIRPLQIWPRDRGSRPAETAGG